MATTYQTIRDNLPVKPKNSTVKAVLHILLIQKEENVMIQCSHFNAETFVLCAFKTIRFLHAPSAHQD